MANGVNKCIIIGNVGGDPKSITTSEGRVVTNLTIATSESWKDKNTGEKVEKTEWHNISMFGPLAEITAKFVKKGSKIYVEGKLETKKWTDKEGIERYKTSIVASSMQMLGGKSDNNTSEVSSKSEPRWSNSDHGNELKDDDIPF